MSLQSELDAIRTSAAIYPLTDRAFLRITGSDATRWLNGMVTNNIKDLAQGEGNYNFLLNAQGRILGDCTLYREPTAGDPTYLLETDTSQIEAIQNHLDKFIIMDDVELSTIVVMDSYPTTSQPAGMALLGGQASERLPKLFSANHEVRMDSAPQPGTMMFGMVNGTSVIILTPTSQPIPRHEIWFHDEREMYLERDILHKKDIIDISNQAQEAHRILTATPRYGTDIRNTETAKDLPQETAQTHALHFSKGCYLGQEIVERIHSRGNVHRTFTQFRLTGELPQLPAILTANAKPAGELTSATQIGDEIIALGYLRREFQNQPITYPGGIATPTTASKNSDTNKLEASS